MDGYGHTGISRLEGLRQVREGNILGPKRVAGAKLSIDQVDLRLTVLGNVSLPAPGAITMRIAALLFMMILAI